MGRSPRTGPGSPPEGKGGTSVLCPLRVPRLQETPERRGRVLRGAPCRQASWCPSGGCHGLARQSASPWRVPAPPALPVGPSSEAPFLALWGHIWDPLIWARRSRLSPDPSVHPSVPHQRGSGGRLLSAARPALRLPQVAFSAVGPRRSRADASSSSARRRPRAGPPAVGTCRSSSQTLHYFI